MMPVQVGVGLPFEFAGKNGIVQKPALYCQSDNGMPAIDLTEITIIFRKPGCNLMHLRSLVRRAYDKKYFLFTIHGVFQHTIRLKVLLSFLIVKLRSLLYFRA